MADEVKLNLVQKLAAIRREVRNVEKRGENSFQRYNYVMAADVAGLIGNRLADFNISIEKIEQKVSTGSIVKENGKNENWALVECLYCFWDGDVDGHDCLKFWSTGYGVDAGDKAIYKALTGCFKYFLVQAFCLAMGDDPEADEDTDKRNAEATKRKPKDYPVEQEVQKTFPDAQKVQYISSEQVDELYDKCMRLAEKAPDRARVIFDRSGVSMDKVVTGSDPIEDDAFIKELTLTTLEDYTKRMKWLEGELAK